MGDGVDERELREMIRASIARQLGTGVGAPSTDPRPHLHVSHVRLALPQGGDGDGACLIEPAVRCTHCGYCQSYGH
ncbi:MAG: hypothetical protein HY047_19170 [Acidobacteria bacterium]|nr:hypothetical protein [Acidobacteriota bacterium]